MRPLPVPSPGKEGVMARSCDDSGLGVVTFGSESGLAPTCGSRSSWMKWSETFTSWSTPSCSGPFSVRPECPDHEVIQVSHGRTSWDRHSGQKRLDGTDLRLTKWRKIWSASLSTCQPRSGPRSYPFRYAQIHASNS